jgi:tetratricopeptide (TPR) repeat protein
MISKYLLLLILLVSWGAACAPTSKTVHIADGKYLQVTNQHEKAIKFFKDFLKQNPASAYAPEAYYLIGESYERLNQPKSAVEAYRQVLDKYLKSPYAALSYRRLAKYQAARGNYEKAIKYYKLAMDVLRSDANRERCTFEIAKIYQTGVKDYKAALKEYQKLTKDLKNKHLTVLAYLNIGYIFKQQKDYEKAKSAFQTIVDEYSWSSEVSKAKEELEKLSAQAGGSTS